MHRTVTILGAAALLFAAGPLAAQDTARAGAPRPAPRAQNRIPRQPEFPGEVGPGMRRGGPPARMILGLRQRLQLTDDQVRRLEGLATSQREALRPDEPAMLRARADLMEAVRKDNIEGARAAMDRMSRLRTDVAVAHLRARKEARDVLTAEQRARLDEMGPMGPGRVRPAAGARPGRAFRGRAPRAPRPGLRAPRPRPNRPPMEL